MAEVLIVIIILILLVLGVVKIGVDGVLIQVFFLDAGIRTVKLGRANGASLLLAGEALMPSSFLERQHQTTTFHLLGTGGNLGMKKTVYIDSGHLDEVTVGIALHHHAFELVVRAIHLRVAESALAVGVGTSLLDTLLLGSHSGGDALAVLLSIYGLRLARLTGATLRHLTLGVMTVHGADRCGSTLSVLVLQSLSGALLSDAVTHIGLVVMSGLVESVASKSGLLLNRSVILSGSRLSLDLGVVGRMMGGSNWERQLLGILLRANLSLGVVGSRRWGRRRWDRSRSGGRYSRCGGGGTGHLRVRLRVPWELRNL